MSFKVKTVNLGPDIHLSTDSGIVYDFTSRTESRTDPLDGLIGGHKVVLWGRDNLLPYQNRKILAENDIKQMLINTDTDITAGKGLIPYKLLPTDSSGKRNIEFVVDPELEDWRDELMLNDFYAETIQDLKEFGNSWPEFILSRDRSTLVSIMSLDAVDCRLKKPQKTAVRRDASVLLVADWKYLKLTELDIQEVPLLERINPQLGEYGKCAYHVKIHYSGQPYYSLTEWHGTKNWTKVSNRIPEFHLNGLENGYMLRYHLKIPESYLNSRIQQLRNSSTVQTEDEAVKAVKTEIQDQLDSVLSGSKHAHKTFFSWIKDNIPDAKGWSLEKIETDLKDDSYLKLSDMADKKHARGHNLHPVLAGIETSGSLSSGSEILNLINYHVAYKTPRVRRTALKPIDIAFKFAFPDKWAEGIRWGVEDVVFTTLDNNPNGQQAASNG